MAAQHAGDRAGTVLAAPAGGHAINLAAISAALAAGPDTARRWIAAASSGGTYLVLGLSSAALTTLVTLAPNGVVETVAGLALLGALTGALRGALTGATRPAEATAAVITLVITASGTTIAGIESAFWALLAGLVARWWLLRGTPAS
ncbi:benzoate/H(+) symporter BenE family transporter [Flexivirga caeni]|uniref:benzoate/H(+) symporter BenE family transporter n=1 Tax=Flexivirga caeni TaxID=2294115 RepID=UPI003CCC5D81